MDRSNVRSTYSQWVHGAGLFLKNATSIRSLIRMTQLLLDLTVINLLLAFQNKIHE